jgi:hypothetical protein
MNADYTAVCGSVRNYTRGKTTLSVEFYINDATEIFVRINSKDTPLNQADSNMSKIAAAVKRCTIETGDQLCRI